MDCSWTIERSGEFAFVAVRLESSASVPRRVRIANRLDGPVLPPRRDGVPEPGYDADGVTIGVPANGSRSVGFACAADSREPPVELVDVARVDAAESVAAATPVTAALDDLGPAAPPRNAIPGGEASSSGTGAAEATSEHPTESDTDRPAEFDSDRPIEAASDRSTETASDRSADPGRDAATEWLDAVERRIERGERLTNASVEAATAALRETGDLDAASALGESIDDDAARVAEVATRAAALAERAERVDVPIEALRRLA